MNSRKILNILHHGNSQMLSKRFLSLSAVANQEGWLNKLLVRNIEPTKESHSTMLSDKEIIFELQTHDIKPDCHEKYLKNYENYVNVVQGKDVRAELKGSWSVAVGDQDQYLHLWKYAGGYPSIDNSLKVYRDDSEISSLVKERSNYLRKRSNQYLLSFSYWPPITPREGEHIYEIRSYFLKPGTMIEWGNNWARAINFRQENNETFAGFFSQVGRLYNVHHIWCYSSLMERKHSRESAWHKPGWDQVVAYTVPLIKEMHTRIMVPTKFSPAM